MQRIFHRAGCAAALLAAMALAGCNSGYFGGSDSKEPLKGERISVLSLDTSLKPDKRIQDVEVRLPRPYRNADWPQPGGVPTHANYHLAAPGKLAVAWQVDAGEGSSDDAQLLAPPVVAAGRVYVLDAAANLRAFDAKTGRDDLACRPHPRGRGRRAARRRRRLLSAAGSTSPPASPTCSRSTPQTGKRVWTHRVSGPMRAGPTVLGGRVFVVTIANELHALVRRRWARALDACRHRRARRPPRRGEPGGPGRRGGRRLHVGRAVRAARRERPRRLAGDADAAAPRRPGLRDRPDQGRSGDRPRPGDRHLQLRPHGRRSTCAPAGACGSRRSQACTRPGSPAPTSTSSPPAAEVVCLDRRDGGVRWVTQLPRYRGPRGQGGPDPLDRAGAGRRTGCWCPPRTARSGPSRPIPASRWAASSSGPACSIAPAVADGTVYVLTDDATLVALR